MKDAGQRVGAAVARGCGSALGWMMRRPLGVSQWVAAALWLVALAGGMVKLGDHIAATANLDAEAADQTAYLMLVEAGRGSAWPAVTDGTRNPLFPWLLARFAEGERAELFVAGKRLNVRLAAAVALGVGLWAALRMAWLPAMTCATIGGFGILMPIGTYVGAEVIFYGLVFVVWMTGLALLARFSFSACALLGAALGFAYLAKPGTAPALGALGAVALARWAWAWRLGPAADSWRGLRPLGGAAIALLVGVAIVAPRGAYAWARFGDPLQSTAAWCFWAEDWEDCLPKLVFFNPRRSHALPAEERPTAQRFLARHGWGGIWKRLGEGAGRQIENFLQAEPKSLWWERAPTPERPVRRLFPYRGVVVLVVLCGVAAMLPPAIGRGLAGTVWFQVGFAGLWAVASFGAFSWYAAIAPGARFILALYLPILASTLLAGEALRQTLSVPRVDGLWGGLLLLVLTAFLAHLGGIALHPHFGPLRGVF